MEPKFCSRQNCHTQLVEHDGQLVCPYHDIKREDRTLMDRYMIALGDPHNLKGLDLRTVNHIDYFLRESIGKTDDIRIPACSHQAIVNREFGEKFCRVCQKDMSKVGGRINDFLVLRHPQCTQPICCECAEQRPDIFYLAFKYGLEEYTMLKASIARITTAMAEGA